jgi:hypothetical protein
VQDILAVVRLVVIDQNKKSVVAVAVCSPDSPYLTIPSYT